MGARFAQPGFLVYVFLEASNPTDLLRKRWQVLPTQAPWVDSMHHKAEQRHRFIPDSRA